MAISHTICLQIIVFLLHIAFYPVWTYSTSKENLPFTSYLQWQQICSYKLFEVINYYNHLHCLNDYWIY